LRSMHVPAVGSSLAVFTNPVHLDVKPAIRKLNVIYQLAGLFTFGGKRAQRGQD
jgi:hypothetical protein